MNNENIDRFTSALPAPPCSRYWTYMYKNSEAVQYELCSYPYSLFDSALRLQVTVWSDLLHELLKRVPLCINNEYPVGVNHVVDGWSMLHRLPWPKSMTYYELCQLYIQFIHNRCHRALVVFDGYITGHTTDQTHERRIGNEIGR